MGGGGQLWEAVGSYGRRWLMNGHVLKQRTSTYQFYVSINIYGVGLI